MSLVEISKLNFAYDADPVILSVSLDIQRGTVISLLGPSGCGKSTLLRLVAGLEIPTDGQITFAADSRSRSTDLLRFLFQDYDAYPWLTVRENVRSGSGIEPLPSIDAVDEMLHRVGLADSKGRYPAELSGGMKKRLALARCLIRRPALMLLDEPFSSLDFEAKCGLYNLVQNLWAENQSTVILVTHDPHEAILLSDRILVSAPKPFRVIEDISVGFDHPRVDSIINTVEYSKIRQQLTKALKDHYSGQ